MSNERVRKSMFGGLCCFKLIQDTNGKYSMTAVFLGSPGCNPPIQALTICINEFPCSTTKASMTGMYESIQKCLKITYWRIVSKDTESSASLTLVSRSSSFDDGGSMR